MVDVELIAHYYPDILTKGDKKADLSFSPALVTEENESLYS